MKKYFIRQLFPEKKALSSSLRIIIPLYATYILFVLIVFLFFLPMTKTHLMDQKKKTIRELTLSTISLLSEYHQQVQQGELKLQAAQKRAINRIRNLRYGPEGKDYFWILNMQHQVVMHPYRPELEGKSQTDIMDSEGNQLWISMVNKVKEKGEGYINYKWQWKDDTSQIVPKISFVYGFSPWGWVIGTGMYIGDINEELKLIRQGFLKIFSFILIIIILMSLYITRQTFRIEKNKSIAERAKKLEELRLKTLFELSQMTDATTKELTEFALEEVVQLTQSDIGYLAFIDKKETWLTIHTWSRKAFEKCRIQDKKLVCRIDETGLWGEAIRSKKAQVINDYNAFEHPMKKGYPAGHIQISRVMNIPVFDNEKIVALAGVANKLEPYNESDVRQLRLMMDGMWKIFQKNQARYELQKSEERYRLLADNATDNIWILQLSDLSFSYMSPSVEQLLGFEPEEYVNIEFGRQMTADSLKKVTALIEEEMEREKEGIDTKRYRAVELELIKKDGTKIWAEVTASFLRDENGKPDRVLGITRSIDERRQLESKLRQAQKMEAIGTLAGGIAHDFNNILSSMMGFTELAKLAIKDDPQTLSHLDQVLAAGIRARDLVKHILTFSRKADVQKGPIEITPLIKECIKFLRASIPMNIEIQEKFDTENHFVVADPTQIHQVLMNLFTNAAYAMKDKGGTLEIQMKSVIIDNIENFQAKEIDPGQYLLITISDTGCGISKEVVTRIFEPFFTTKKRGEGTGMGLSTVFGIVKDMDGMITVYSEPGMGTTFRVLIPEQEGENNTSDTVMNFLSLTGKGKILLVDDETSIVDWTTQILLKLGYEVICSTDSVQALALFNQHPDAFDLVLTDMAMPQIDGLELSRQIKAVRHDIPILLCTGFSEGLTEGIIKEAGIADMVMKPMIASELAQAIDRAIKGKSKTQV